MKAFLKSGKAKLLAIGVLVATLVMSFSPINFYINPTMPQSQSKSLSVGNQRLVLTIGNVAHATGTLDYAWNGVNDNVNVAAAIAVLNSHGGGELVMMTENYTFLAAVNVPANVMIRGLGASTKISFNGVNPVFVATGANVVFRDFNTDAGGVTALSTTLVENINGNTPTGRTATYVIAASTANQSEKAQADIILDGVNDQVELNAADISGYKVHLSSGIFHVSSLWTVRNATFDGEGKGKTVISLDANVNGVQIYRDGNIQNLTVNATVAGYTSKAVTVGADEQYIDQAHNLLDGVSIESTAFTGTGLYIFSGTSITAASFIELSTFGSIMVNGFSNGFQMYASNETGGIGISFINGNVFRSLVLGYNIHPFTIDSIGTSEVNGNTFVNIEIQPTAAGTVDGLYFGKAVYNRVLQYFAWDWSLASGSPINLSVNSTQNRIEALLLPATWQDAGSGNLVVPVNKTADNQTSSILSSSDWNKFNYMKWESNQLSDSSLMLYNSFYTTDERGTSFSSRDNAIQTNTANGTTWTTRGRLFNGTTDSIQIAPSSTINNPSKLTASAWIKPITIGGGGNGGRIFNRFDNVTATGWIFTELSNLGTNKLWFLVNYVTTNLDVYSPPSSLPLGSWEMVTVAWDGTGTAANVKFYLNGVQLTPNTTNTNGTGARQTDNTTTLSIGNTSALNRGFDGTIGETWLFSRQKTDAEIYNDWLSTKWRYGY